MPFSYQPNDNQRPFGEPRTRAGEGLPEDAFVFCSFARTDKYNPEMFSIWCELVKGTPGSVLWLWEQNKTATRALIEFANAHGVKEEQIIFARSYGPEQHLARLGLADLGLDSFPYTSHTTGSDLLWAGVPLLAMRGDTFASRVSASLVTAAGMPELVVDNFDDYLSLGLALANAERPRLEALTQKLRQNRATLPLFDTARFTRHLAHLYRRMWRNFLAGAREPIVLTGD
jgi:predicted O-linked N-acetylglucosamine transferase (SPINDLY family)